MIGKVIELLHTDEWYGVSDKVEIAKGKYEKVTTWRSMWRYIKRSRKNVRKTIS